ncbi:ABC transporter permease [Fulvivirgaceae bacterium BMA10]|uniref:ABC transporter permease n=1 Tax=Splendidivirga corallicola TaxID=3051826 RepID=A0ABT8KNY4_9BACT|nr:ABC transporter permease [Fulvivirgaceae bacterium BMA10]
MLKNFLKTFSRSLVKNKLISFINIFGLSIAIGCSLVVYIFVDWQFSMDQFHVNRNNIFLLQNVVSRDGSEQVWGDSPAPIGDALEADFSQIKRVVRIDNRGTVFKYKDKIFNEFVRFVNPEFLDMFTFPLRLGEKEALQDPSNIILSDRIAEKYFGEENPIGKQVELILNNKKESFIVAGVAEKFPKTASFAFNILINFEKKFNIYDKEDPNDWKDFIGSTFIELNDPADIELISSKMDKYVAIQNEAEEDWPASAYTFQPLSTLSLNSYKIRGDIASGDDPVARIVLSLIGIFMMTLACFNYINIAIVSSAKRLKEIGLRKVVGGTKQQLVFQFIGENLIICLFALILGGVWARFLFGPWFDNLFSIGLELDFYKSVDAWVFFTALLVITGIGSGAYPAFYISSFKAVNIFRGQQQFGKGNKFTKVFLTFQFILSIITIVFGITFVQNADYQKERDWGYNQSQTLVVPVDGENTYVSLKNEYLQNPDIVQVAGSGNHVGRSSGLAVIDYNSKKYEIRRIDVGHNYLETLGIRLKQGRFFEEERATDVTESVVINQTFMDHMNWEQPLGQSFDLDTITYHVVGVVEDFHYQNFHNEIEPTFFRMTTQDKFRYLSLKVKAGQATKIGESMEASWKVVAPDLPYNGFFQDTVFDRYFNNVQGHGRVMGFTATLAIILSCMGLFGLVSLNVTARMREFSIRKVLGAGIKNIFTGINKHYIWLLLIACIIGLPVSYYLVSILLEEVYEYYMPLTFVPLLIAMIILFTVSLITVSSQIYKVVVSNPVDSLRVE